MSDTNFWTYVIPYVDVSIASDTQLIAGNNFDIVNRILWLQFNSFYIDDVADALGGQPESSITGQLNEDNEFCSYDLIYNEDGNRGSFPYKIVGHSTRTNWNSIIDQSNKYMGIASLGNIDMPFFRDITKIIEIVTESSEILDLEDSDASLEAEQVVVTGAQVKEIGDISFSYSYDLEAFYRGEETLIKENWQQYTSEKSEYSGFIDAYDGYVNDFISNSYVESNSDQKFFVFQKTTKPINLNYMSTLPDPVIDDVVSTAATTTTTTTSDTVITTSGFTEAGSAIIEASNPVVNTDTSGLASGGSAGGYS